MKSTMLKSTFVVMMIIATGTIFGQPPGGGGGSGSGGPPPTTGAPVDGGALMFLIGVAGYAYTSLKSKKQEN
ncbi:MAG: hypothetical protein JST90_02035 [Bacteroidetes bacterium]|nr:hypothetical protein [Bacteroidota bacterium]